MKYIRKAIRLILNLILSTAVSTVLIMIVVALAEMGLSWVGTLLMGFVLGALLMALVLWVSYGQGAK